MRRRFEPEPAGRMLQSRFLDDYELTAEEFAVAIRVPAERAERLLAGLEPLDADMALRLAKLFGGSADGWLERNAYTPDLLHATPFKSKEVAEATAAVLGERRGVVEITKEDLRKPVHNNEVNRHVRDCLLKNSGQGMSVWDVGTYLRNEADMTAYLEAAADDGDCELIAVAVADVMKAMTEKTTVEYLRATRQIKQ